jgi:hypothetical protein
VFKEESRIESYLSNRSFNLLPNLVGNSANKKAGKMPASQGLLTDF